MNTLHTAQLDNGDYSFTFTPHRVPLSGEHDSGYTEVVVDDFPADIIGETDEVEAEAVEAFE